MLVDGLVQNSGILSGIGPKTEYLLEKTGINNLGELLKYFPREYIDRSRIYTIADSLERNHSVCLVKIIDKEYFGRKRILKIKVKDHSATASLLCFGRNFLSNTIVQGKSYIFYGTFKYKYSEIQSSNFELEEYSENNPGFARMLPVYKLTSGLTQNTLRKAVKSGLKYLESNGLPDEELPSSILEKYNFKTEYQNLKNIHFPENKNNIKNASHYYIYKELFYLLLLINFKKNKSKKAFRKSIFFNLKKQVLSRLPFSITSGQEKALEEIEQDLFSADRMYRILQGDVGCGKTLVSILAAVSVIEAGEQVALMVPTSLLAKQHAETVSSLVEPLGIRTALFTGSLKKDKRKLLIKALKNGDIDIVIGTHSLTSPDVEYKSLGLAVIDEQHRFGVLRRTSLTQKGQAPDLLLMTATPIPRTLAQTVFTELDISAIKTMPPGRKKVITHLSVHGNENKVYEAVKIELNKGRQAYFIYPLIEESKNLDLKNAEDMLKNLSVSIYPDKKAALIHSKTTREKAEYIMNSFKNGNIDILVSTTIIEVGVDVPNATCMVIEHAERFGLAVLHQLRGRVGRGEYQSYAFLVYSDRLTENSIRRLKIMKETTDGFKIAEEDLKIRGPGEILGIMQSGFPELIYSDLESDMDILKTAKNDLESILKVDKELKSQDNEPIRKVLDKKYGRLK